ncbi:methyltransferase [Nonomuraea pusilla]|uniref:methyltransferase n=1 Tax=Nonomuraea pusilla TaxID=46177 RepID=UPI0033333A27
MHLLGISGTWTTPGPPPPAPVPTAAYARHVETLRGVVRHELVARALRTHLPAGPARVLDVGGGDAWQAVRMARDGREVTVLDPDPEMLERARRRLLGEPDAVRARVRLVEGAGEDAPRLVGGGYDAVTCHGVLMYLREPGPLADALVAAARPGGLLSVMTKNAAALALRPGLERRWPAALAALRAETGDASGGRPQPGGSEVGGAEPRGAEAGAAQEEPVRERPPWEGPVGLGLGPGEVALVEAGPVEMGNVGVPTRADTVEGLAALLARSGAETVTWYGVRIFTDHLGDEPVPPDVDQMVDAEWEAGRRDPYRRIARQIHLIARALPRPTG